MIRELKLNDGEYGFVFTGNHMFDSFPKILAFFEAEFKPTEKKCITAWHNEIYEYGLGKVKDNKIRIECSDEIVTIYFVAKSDDDSRQVLKEIAQLIDLEFNNGLNG